MAHLRQERKLVIKLIAKLRPNENDKWSPVNTRIKLCANTHFHVQAVPFDASDGLKVQFEVPPIHRNLVVKEVESTE